MIKLLIIAFDGADHEHFTKHAPQNEYTSCILMSHAPPHMITGPAFASIYTGVNPLKHKIYHTWGVQYKGSDCLLSSKAMPFWRHLNQYQKKCELVNLPLTFPPQAVNRFMISGFPVFRQPARNLRDGAARTI